MNVKDVIKTITIRAKAEGVAEATQALKGMQSAQEGLATTSDTSAKGQLSLSDAVSKAERRFNTALRAQQDYEKVQRQMNAAVAQNPALQERANAVLALASDHFARAATGSRAFAAAQAELQARATGLANSLGSVGAVLGSIGPVGLGVGAGLGIAALAFKQLVDGVNALAERSGKMVDFSESVGVSTNAIQKLTKVGAEVGVDAEKITTSFERFAVQVDQVREGSGELFKQLNRVSPELLRQMVTARDLGKAFDVLADAQSRAANVEQKAALMRAAFGRGGVSMGRVAEQARQAGGTEALPLSRLAPGDEELKRWDALDDKIKAVTKEAHTNILSMFADDVLNAELKFAQGLLSISEWMKDFKASAGWNDFILGVQALAAAAPGIGPALSLAAGATRNPNSSGVSQPRDALGGESLSDMGMSQVGALGGSDRAATEEKAAAAVERQLSAAQQLAAAERDLAAVVEARTISAERALAAETQISAVVRLNQILDTESAAAKERGAQATLNMAAQYPGMTIETAKQLNALEGQLQVAMARTGQEKMIAQEQATITSLLLQNKTLEEATAQAVLQRAIAQAQINAAADQQLKSLQQQGELLRASVGWEQDRIKAAQTYQNLLDQGVDSLLAQKVAMQQLSNADAERSRQEESQQQQADQAAQQAQQQAAAAAQQEAQQVQTLIDKANALAYEWERVAGALVSIDWDKMEVVLSTMGNQKLWTDPNTGQKVQFNPEGYVSGGPVADLQDMQRVAANLMYGAGNYKEQQVPIGGGMAALQFTPNENKGLAALADIQTKAMQAMEKLTESTDSLNATMQSALSPYYSQDPRTTKLGFRAGVSANPDWMAGGTNDNSVAAITGWTGTQGYADGGSFTVPGGYSSNDNKMVSFAARSGETVSIGTPEKKGISIDNRVVINGNVDASTVDKLKRTQYQQAQRIRAMLVA